MEAEEFLTKVTLFRQLERTALEHLAAQMRLLYFPEGLIVKEGDSGDGFYIIKAGVAKITRSSGPGRAEAVLALLRRGDSFGEVALIDGLPRTANVTAMQPMECYFLPRDAFLAALEQYPRIAKDLLPSLAGMVRVADQWVAHLL